MKVAIPIWLGRVSPVFDTARRLLLIEADGGEVFSRREENLRETFPPLRVKRLKELGVELLICGALSNSLACLIRGAGITLIPWVSGGTDDIIEAYGNGTLSDPKFMMPGCGGRRRRFQRAGMGKGRQRRGRDTFG